MLTVCPSCRHTFQADVQDECSTELSISTTIRLPTVCPSGVNCTVNVSSSIPRRSETNSALSKEDLIRNTLSGGSVICINDDTYYGIDDTNNKRFGHFDQSRNLSSSNNNNNNNNNNRDKNNDDNSNAMGYKVEDHDRRLFVSQSIKYKHDETNKSPITTTTDNNNNNNNNATDDYYDNSRTSLDKNRKCSDSITPTSVLSFVIPQSASSSDFASYSVELDRLLKKTVVRNFSLSSSSEQDLQRLTSSLTHLQLSGWYHKGLSWKDAIHLLMPSSVGTFLVRDSSDSHFLYSLSVQTKYGPTSIRIYYYNGEFRLDAESRVAKFMPRFSCVLKLIQYYVESTKTQPLTCFHNEMQTISSSTALWNNDLGRAVTTSSVTSSTSVTLVKPLYAVGRFPTLKHLSRLAVNRHFVRSDDIVTNMLPNSLIGYLQQYPYKY